MILKIYVSILAFYALLQLHYELGNQKGAYYLTSLCKIHESLWIYKHLKMG